MQEQAETSASDAGVVALRARRADGRVRSTLIHGLQPVQNIASGLLLVFFNLSNRRFSLFLFFLRAHVLITSKLLEQAHLFKFQIPIRDPDNNRLLSFIVREIIMLDVYQAKIEITISGDPIVYLINLF